MNMMLQIGECTFAECENHCVYGQDNGENCPLTHNPTKIKIDPYGYIQCLLFTPFESAPKSEQQPYRPREL